MKSPSLPELFESFLYDLGATKPSPHTIRAYRTDFKGVAGRLAVGVDMEVDKLGARHLTRTALRQAFASWASDHAAASVTRAWSTWNHFIDWAVSEDHVAGNPMPAVGKPRRPPDPVRYIRGTDTTARLLRTALTLDDRARRQWCERDAALLATFAVTGVRRAEACALDLRSIDGPPGGRRLVVTGKGRKTRYIPIYDLETWVNRYLDSRRERFPDQDLTDPGAPLFIDTRGRRISVDQVWYWVGKLYARAGMRVDIPPGAMVHALRHTFAMDALAGGASVLEVQALLGHANLSATQHYVRATDEGLREAVRSHPAQAALRQDPQFDVNH